MQSLTKSATVIDVESEKSQSLSNWQLFFLTGALIVSSSFTYSTYPAPVNAAALGVMVALFYYNLHRQDGLSFLIQLFIGNFFAFGNKFGGNCNIAAFASIVFYLAVNRRFTFLLVSTFDNSIKSAFVIWYIFDLLSVTGGNFFPLATELQNFFSFGIMLLLCYTVSRIPFSEEAFYKFLFAISIFFSYEFFVALNQKFEWYDSPYPFFPSTEKNIEFELGIVRSVSTLNNFEAFAEFCVSLIALLLPGILSGSSLKKSRLFYYFSIYTIVVAIISIVFSGTRSSIALLPLVILGACFLLGKRLKARLVILMVVVVSVFFILNTSLKIIDLSVFEERSETMDHVTLQSMINGDAMNRGGLFPYAFKQMQNTNGVIGRGYFVSPAEYRFVHFGYSANTFESIADYHNLYMSAWVMWGPIGFLCLMFLLLYSLIRGWTTYWVNRKRNHFTTDLLLGFNLLFVVLLINQFKIQFIRDINYFSIIMLLLVCYISLIHLIKQAVPAENISIRNMQLT